MASRVRALGRQVGEILDRAEAEGRELTQSERAEADRLIKQARSYQAAENQIKELDPRPRVLPEERVRRRRVRQHGERRPRRSVRPEQGLPVDPGFGDPRGQLDDRRCRGRDQGDPDNDARHGAYAGGLPARNRPRELGAAWMGCLSFRPLLLSRESRSARGVAASRLDREARDERLGPRLRSGSHR